MAETAGFNSRRAPRRRHQGARYQYCVPQSARLGETELKAREQLALLGSEWMPCYPNTKVWRKGAAWTRRIPSGNAVVRLPRSWLGVDVDSREGLLLAHELVDGWPRTLLLGARRGPRWVFR